MRAFSVLSKGEKYADGRGPPRGFCGWQGVIEVDVLSGLIAGIYDASLDQALWSAVHKRTCEFIGGCSAALFSQDFAAQSGRFYFSWNDNPEYTASFFQTYIRINPLTPHLMMTKVGEIYSASRLMPYDELVASRFFQEWCVPQGYTDLVATNLDKTATSLATISVGRDVTHGLVDDEALRRMALLAPHFRRAVLISRVIELHTFEASTMAAVLDGLAAALFLVDGRAAIVYANSRGRAVLDDGDLVARNRATLTLNDSEANRTLREVIAEAESGDAAVATRGIAVAMKSLSGERHVAHLMPLTSGARLAAGLSHAAVAAVFIRKASVDLPLPIEAIAREHHLTDAEIRVLYSLMEASGVPAMAAMLGVSDDTVKTHLRHIFDKTGARNQVDLVKLVAGLSSPLDGGDNAGSQ